ncbi:MAG: OmpA family protein [Deltaproteobacteria bacterium]|nr:OmpA family protein [Deltaproteobacteria bacterium]
MRARLVLPLLMLSVGCSCSRPPRVVEPRPGDGDAGAPEPADAPPPADVAPPPPEIVAPPPDADLPLPPEVAGDDEHPVRIFFEEGKSEVPEIANALLDAVSERLRLRPTEVLRLVGHCDSREKPGGAMELSRQRVNAVRRHLEEHGVDTNRFFVDARGDFQPAGDNETPDGRAANRRVDFVFEQGMMSAP